MAFDATLVKCPECHSRNISLDEKQGERFCEDCGFMVETSMLDYGAEWRSFGSEAGVDKNNSRVGSPTNYLIHDKGLSTEIDWANRDYAGKVIKNEMGKFHRMRRWQKRARGSRTKDRNLTQALTLIQAKSVHLEIPESLKSESAMLYRRALEKDLIRGRPINTVVAAIMFIINRKYYLPKTIDDYCIEFNLSKKELGRTYRNLRRKLRVKITPPPADMFVERYCGQLSLDRRVITATTQLIDICDEREMLDGKSPSGFTAACIYITSNIMGQNRTQRDISEVCNVTEVTIRNRYKQIARDLNMELDFEKVKPTSDVMDWIKR